MTKTELWIWFVSIARDLGDKLPHVAAASTSAASTSRAHNLRGSLVLASASEPIPAETGSGQKVATAFLVKVAFARSRPSNTSCRDSSGHQFTAILALYLGTDMASSVFQRLSYRAGALFVAMPAPE